MTASIAPSIFSKLSKTGLGPSAVVATVDVNGNPHTAPFGSLKATSPGVLRFGCDRRHDTYFNILRNSRVMICLVAPPDIAVSISGRAKVAKERMELVDTDAVIEVEIEDVKSDLIPGTKIETGITYSVDERMKSFIEEYVAEVAGQGLGQGSTPRPK